MSDVGEIVIPPIYDNIETLDSRWGYPDKNLCFTTDISEVRIKMLKCALCHLGETLLSHYNVGCQRVEDR